MTSIHAVILGAAGYGGGELLRVLSRHPSVGSIQAVSGSHAGRAVSEAHPNLAGHCRQHFIADPDWRSASAGETLVVFNARRNGELASQFQGISADIDSVACHRKLLVDLSGDFRLSDPESYQDAYGVPHPHPQALGSFVYGLPEANRSAILGANRIASPGCFATAIALALLPFAKSSIQGQTVVFGATGSSGSGAHASPTTHHPTRAGDFRAYKVLAHQHEAEIIEMLVARGFKSRLSFVPHSMPLVRGIFASVYIELPLDEASGAPDLVATYYESERFVRLVEGSPRVAAVAGSNYCEIAVAVRGAGVVVMSAIDNLLKGMAGQAVQSMNIALGLPEDSGLDFVGGWPS